jgi:hypothetical protein
MSERMQRTNTRADEGRENEKRETAEAVRGATAEEQLQKFRTEMYNNAMPTLPKIPGHHTCWLSTTNPYDTLAHRESWGYTRVMANEIPGCAHMTVTQGQFAGCIMLNEMILAKIPDEQHHQMLLIAHHERPYQEEERVREIADYVQQQAQEGGGAVYLEEGTRDIVNARRVRNPTFSE